MSIVRIDPKDAVPHLSDDFRILIGFDRLRFEQHVGRYIERGWIPVNESFSVLPLVSSMTPLQQSVFVMPVMNSKAKAQIRVIET